MTLWPNRCFRHHGWSGRRLRPRWYASCRRPAPGSYLNSYRRLWMEFWLCTGSDCATIKITSWISWTRYKVGGRSLGGNMLSTAFFKGFFAQFTQRATRQSAPRISAWTSFTLSEMWEDSKSHFSSHHFPQGKNGLLFTYGVTGSGKTHTMQVLR